MYRFTSIAVVVLLLVSTGFAQISPATSASRNAGTAGYAASTASSGGGALTLTNCFGVQNGRVPIFTVAAAVRVTLCNSGIYEAMPYGSGPIGILNPNPIAALDVTGDINTSLYYQIGGSTVLTIGNQYDENVFLGVGAGSNNMAKQGGVNNTFSGYEAGHSNTAGYSNTFTGTGGGYYNTTGNNNTFLGLAAGYYNTTGGDNAFTGTKAGYYNTTGGDNVFSGAFAGYSNSTGCCNTFSGVEAGYSNTTASANTFYGENAGVVNTTGNNNTFLGQAAGYYNTTGGDNVFTGTKAGYYNTTGNNNIYIGNVGGNGLGSESNAIRIGGDIGIGPQTAAYIVGIYGSTASGGVPVYINSNGQLGSSASSLRFKEQVRDMGDSTNALMKLRPVTFRYKAEYDNGERTLQYGLIAEEVATVYPELVAYDNNGQPYSVRYQYLTSMLLNEAQKQYRRAEVQAEVIKAQKQKIDELEQRLSRLERLIGNQEQMVAQK